MKVIAVICLLSCSMLAQTPTSPLRHIPLSAEQNKLLVMAQRQMDGLEQQARQVVARRQAIVDTIAATNKIQNGKLNEIKPGEFEIEEVAPEPKKVEPKQEKP